MTEDAAIRQIKEYRDRWIMSPMRGGKVDRSIWQSDEVELIFSNSFRLTMGYDAELSPRSVAQDAPERKAITRWDRRDVEQFLCSPVVSPVFFKSGAARIAFKNGWKLLLRDDAYETNVALYDGDSLLWTRAGLSSRSKYPVVRIDSWTGNLVTTPEWPERPDDLDIDYESDDING